MYFCQKYNDSMTASATAEAPATAQPRLILKKPSRHYTFEAYLRREARATEKHEYLDGKISSMPFARGPHNKITANMIAVLKNAVRLRLPTSTNTLYFQKKKKNACLADVLLVKNS